jgi:RHS repeat-associated protein
MVSGNAGSISRQSTTDAQGRLVQVIEDPAGNNYLTAYTYDALDNLTGVTQAGQSNSACPNGQSRCFQYDSLKRLRQANNPESGQLTYTYDASGNLSTKLDARSITATLSYDGMNRVQSKSYSSLGNGVSYVYDGTQSGCSGLGRLASVTSGTSTSNYSCYDAMGHVTTSSQTTAGTTYPAFQYKWNISGTLDTETYPSGRTVTNSYDAAGRVNLVQGQATTGASKMSYASNILYAAQGAMQSLALGNGVSENWSFGTPEQQPTQLAVTGTNANLTLKWGYCPDGTCNDDTRNNGNVLGATIVGNKVNASQQFTYDAINRLATANETNGWSQNYNYDAFGNLTGGAATGIPTAFPASISATNNRITDPGWRYDLAGNVIQSPAAASVVYDAENRQTSYTTSGSAPATATYVYDGEGRRVRKTEADGTTTTYVYDAKGQLAVEYDTGAPAATGTQYLTADNLGSTRMLTDTSGNPVACHDYQPFGAEIPPGINGRGTCYAGTDNPKQKFTGKERDAETGLDYFGARYFSGAQGRFTSADAPLIDQHTGDPQSWNLYAYVRNNPLRAIDPDGHELLPPITNYVYYPVGGATASEALAQADKHFPGSDGNTYAGKTTPELAVTYDTALSGKTGNGTATVTQTITTDKVSLTNTVELPKWTGSDPAEQAAFDKSVGQLKGHEEQHVADNVAAAGALDKSLPGTRSTATKTTVEAATVASGAGLKTKVDAKLAGSFADMTNSAAKLDNQTDHGKKLP